MCPQQACYSVIKSWFWSPLRALVYAVFGGAGNLSLWTGCCERWCWASSRASISHPGEFLWTTGGGSLGESLFPQSELFSVLQHYSLLGLCDQKPQSKLNCSQTSGVYHNANWSYSYRMAGSTADANCRCWAFWWSWILMFIWIHFLERKFIS